MKSRTRLTLAFLLIVVAISSAIASVSLLANRSAEIEQLDKKIRNVLVQASQHPTEPMSQALLVVEENLYNFALILRSQGEEIVLVSPSDFRPTHLSKEQLVKAIRTPITVSKPAPYRLSVLELDNGDFIIVEAPLSSINDLFKRNLARLFLFTVGLSTVAMLIALIFVRRFSNRQDRAALERMQHFLGDASHELRTPLTVIKGYSELLMKNALSDNESRERAHQRVSSEIARMENLIHDLLLLAELGETHKPEYTNCDLAEILLGHVQDFETMYPKRRVDKAIQLGCTLNGVPEHLHRLVANALSNISRHTPEDALVRITLKGEGKSLHLTIEDGGAGLPVSAYGQAIVTFERFDKSRSRESGGSGLGMSIMGAIAVEHKGSLTLGKSSLGGLALIFVFPRQ